MTAAEKQALHMVADRINELASLKNARFDWSKEKDEYIKKEIAPYMTWFKLTAQCLNELADAGNKYEKERALRHIWDL